MTLATHVFTSPARAIGSSGLLVRVGQGDIPDRTVVHVPSTGNLATLLVSARARFLPEGANPYAAVATA